MNFLLFFLSVAAFGLPVNQASHEAEVASLLSLNGPKEDIFKLIAKLRKFNVKVVQDLVQEQDRAKEDVTKKLELKDAAVEAQTNALGAVEDKKAELEILLPKERDAELMEKNARAAMDAARTASASANATLDTEGSRLDAEKLTCQQILSLLKQLAGTVSKEFLDEFKNERRLLSIIDLSDLANADPDSITAVETMVLKLIDDGEEEREHFMKLAKDAADLLNKKTSLHHQAEQVLFIAAGLRKQCEDDLEDLVMVAATATKNANAAKKALSDAQVHLASVNDQLKGEQDRVAKEENVFTEVEKLLNTLA